MKVAAGYVGSIKVFKHLIAWNLLDLPLRTKMKCSHLNHHAYMGKKRRGRAC